MVEELKVIISAEVSKFQSGVAKAKDVIQKFAKDTENARKSVSELWNKMGESATKASGAIIKGVGAIGGALTGTSALTAEYREGMAKLTTAFETAGGSAEVAKETYNDLYRVLGDSDVAVEASNHLAMLTTEEKALNEWTNICQGVFATFGDSLPIEGLTEAVNHTAKLGEVQGTLADALEWSGVNVDEYNEALASCNTEQEREMLLRKTLSSIYDDAAKKYEETAKSTLEQNEAQAELTASLAEIGEAMQPVLTVFTKFANNALKAVTPYVKELSDKYLPKLEKALDEVSKSLQPVIDFIVKHLNKIATVAGIILGIATAYKTLNATITAYNTVKTVFNTVTTVGKTALDLFKASTVASTAKVTLMSTATKAATVATTAFNSVIAFATSPIGAVVIAITALIAIIVTLVKNWDTVSATVKKVWETVKTATSQAVQAVKGKFDDLKQGISTKLTACKETVSNIMDSIGKKFTSVMDSAKNTVKNAIEKIKGFFNFKWELPKIKMPHFKISGSFSLNPPSIPKFSVDWYAKGGVFDSERLFPYGNGRIGGLGEAGAEAIVPLENSPKWVSAIAKQLKNEMGGSNQPIVLKVDGKTFAEIAVDSINDLTRQRGSLPLRLI